MIEAGASGGMRIGAVLVHFRFWPEVTPTLDALLGQSRRADEVVVMDDRSDDGSIEALSAAYPDLEVIVAPHNRGCVANFNAGLELMIGRGADAILLLTHETVMEADVLEKLERRLLEQPEVGEVAPLMGFRSRPDIVFSAGGTLLRQTWENPHAGMYDRIDRWRGTGPRQVPWLDTACALVRATAVRDVGLLEERYYHYYDDVQLGVQLHQAGWRVECLCEAVARQEPGLLPEYYRVRNCLGVLAATAPRRVFARRLDRYARQIARDARDSREGRELAIAQLRGIRDFALGRWGKAPERFTAARRRDDPSIGGALDRVPNPAVDAIAPAR